MRNVTLAWIVALLLCVGGMLYPSTGWAQDQTVTGDLTVTGKVGVGLTPTTHDLMVEKSVPGGNVSLWGKNTDSTNANSHARNYLQVAGPSGGDAKSIFAIQGGNVWAFGLDNSDSDRFKISNNTNLGTSDMFSITPPSLGGNVGIGVGAPAHDLHIEKADAGDLTMFVRNTNSTNANANARFYVQVGGPNAGDAKSIFAITGGQVWSFGLDNSDNDNFKISANTNLGTDDRFVLTPAGNLTVGGEVTVDVLNIAGGSDLAESFNVSGVGAEPEPGMVVCIDPDNPGDLVVSRKAYDRTVAGVLSGAGGVRAGMLMGHQGTLADGDRPVALTGRVYCWADASAGAIEPGDLLTTSERPGHAMKVTDYSQAQGAVIGKAMTSLENGTGLVLALVSLQ